MPSRRKRISRDLLRVGPQRVFRGEDRARIAFPLGGIGTGSISLGGWGQLRDFEIFNRPAKGQECRAAFFTLFARRQGGEPVTRVLQGPIAGHRDYPHGYPYTAGAGLPHFADNSFSGTFPLARVDFADPKVPLRVALEAYNPMMPLEADDSSLPAAVFLVHLANPSRRKAVRAVLFANLENMAGHPELGRNVTESADKPAVRGLRMTTAKHPAEAPEFGSMVLATPWRRVQVQTRWPRLPIFDQFELFWQQASRGKLQERRDRVESPDDRTDIGSIGLVATVKPGASVTLPLVIAWHFPNVRKYWEKPYGTACECQDGRPVWRNHYATRFDDAWDVARHVARNLRRLESRTRAFARALYGSTLPAHVLDAAGSQISVLKTTTCLRLPDGSFYGWEGCHPSAGCCEGTCSHVWNYAQALPHLYPDLQASALENHLKYSLMDDGAMAFRLPLPLGTRAEANFHAAADGQMGIVLNVYRHWTVSGDDQWLTRWWPEARRALEYAWKYWDADRDGVMEGLQHNTYDIEFYGPNTMMTSLYLAALRAGERMARRMGDEAAAEEYRKVHESGSRKADELLWDEDYYVQRIDPGAAELAPMKAHLFRRATDDAVSPPDEPPYQYGRGCLADQLIGQWYAHMLGLGYVLERDHVHRAMASVFRYNFRGSLREHANTHRVYAAGDEAGLVLCTWPHGHCERRPFIYAHEIWPGYEYQVACHLVYEGLLEEALRIVKAVRDRHDGWRRNPWNEVECGNHYARSMSSWSLIAALSGFRWSAPERSVTFAPRVHREDFRTFFVAGTGWGEYRQKLSARGGRAEIRLECGELALRKVTVDPGPDSQPVALKAHLGTRPRRGIPLRRDDRLLELTFDRPVTLRPGRPLVLRWRESK